LTKSNFNAHLAVLFATIIVATTFPIGQRIAPFLDPALSVLLRFLISVLVMLPILLFTDKIKMPTRPRLIQFSMVGATYAGFFILMLTALNYTTSLNTAVIYTLVPSLAAITSFILLKEKLRPIHFVLLPLGILATVWVIAEGSWQKIMALNSNQGDLIFGAGCVLLGLYATLLKKFHIGGSTINMVFWSIVCGSFLLVLYTLFVSAKINLEGIPLEVYLWILYLGVMTVVTAYVWAFAGPILGPMKTVSYSYLVPSFVLFINWIAMDKFPPLLVLPGILVGFVTMFFLQFNPQANLAVNTDAAR
jgi:drug/metabolite transporter (DMT)-like permease